MREVVLDIETIPCSPSDWNTLDDELKKKFLRDEDSDEDARKRTGLDPALGRVVCIGLLFVTGGELQPKMLSGEDEPALLTEFWKAIEPQDYVIGHNVISFDLPFIRARSVVCQVKPSRKFDLRRFSSDTVYDTQEVWSNWEWQRRPKLALLANAFGLGKKLGSGGEVEDWYERKDWQTIERYCEQDVRLTYEIYQRMKAYGL